MNGLTYKIIFYLTNFRASITWLSISIITFFLISFDSITTLRYALILIMILTILAIVALS